MKKCSNHYLVVLILIAECLPARYIFAIMGCMGMGIIYGLKVNLSVAIVSMLNHTAIDILAGKETGGGVHKLKSGEDECSSDAGKDEIEVRR